jgi:hypothetical protein
VAGIVNEKFLQYLSAVPERKSTHRRERQFETK